MKVAVFIAAICIFSLVMSQTYAEEDETAVREARDAKAPVMCMAKCQYKPCKKICMHCCIGFCSNGVYGVCKCLRHGTTRHDTTRHDTTRHDTTRHDTARHGTARHGTARHGTARHGTARHDITQQNATHHNTHPLVLH
ncbi:hypothetical protein LSAT2_001339 [Lamellibrachia satsuma]|nr:hypothetical protein LSAT2_001339 [Lamellibrachia satsuma]